MFSMYVFMNLQRNGSSAQSISNEIVQAPKKKDTLLHTLGRDAGRLRALRVVYRDELRQGVRGWADDAEALGQFK